jgi:hypothetical protein
MEIWDDEVVFINKHGELLEETLYPQFPDVSAEVLNKVVGEALVTPLTKEPNKELNKEPNNKPITDASPARQYSTAKKSKHPSLFKDHTERELVDMIHFREDWGTRRDKRLWQQIVGSITVGMHGE